MNEAVLILDQLLPLSRPVSLPEKAGNWSEFLLRTHDIIRAPHGRGRKREKIRAW